MAILIDDRRVLATVDEGESLGVIRLRLRQIYEKGRGVPFKFDDSLGKTQIWLDYAVEERHHRWANTCHFILIILFAIVTSVWSPASISERIDQRVEGQPHRDQTFRIMRYQNYLLFAEQMGEDRDNVVHIAEAE